MQKSVRVTVTVLLLLAVALTASACGDRAKALRERAAKTYAALKDYEVVAEVTSGEGERADRFVIRQSMRTPDSYRLEWLEPADIKGQLMIRNGRALWSYDPLAGELIISGISPDNFDSNDRILLGDIMARFTSVTDAKYLRSEPGESGALAVVEYADPAPYQQGNKVRLWADAKTGLAERVEYLYSDGSPIQTVVFRELSLNPGLPDGRFNFAVPAGTKVINDDSAVRTVDLEQARRLADFQVLLPARVPDGFALTEVTVSGAEDNLLVTLAYTSGERLIQLSESKYDGAESGRPGGATQVIDGVEYAVDAAEGFASISWTRDGVDITLTADLTLEELFSIAASLK